MPVSLKDQVALVVGASSGIGRAVAVLLARNGASVMAAARREDRLRALKAEMAGHLLEICCADATSVPDVERLVAETRRVLGPIGWKPGGHKGKRNAGSRQRQFESSLVRK